MCVITITRLGFNFVMIQLVYLMMKVPHGKAQHKMNPMSDQFM